MINLLKTGLLLTGLTLIMIALGNMIGGQTGILIALVLAGLMNLGSYWFSMRHLSCIAWCGRWHSERAFRCRVCI